MSKLFVFAIAASMFGAAAATAQACCGGCSTQAAASSCTSAAPAAPTDEHSKMDMPMSKAPQAMRRYSYQSPTGYGAMRAANQQRLSSGVRGASSKALGNF
jgi:hypothetical protein